MDIVEFDDENEEYCKEEYMFQAKLNTSKMINNVCYFEKRNNMVVHLISKTLENEPSRKVLVLSDRKQQLSYLSSKLNGLSIANGFYIGGMSPDALKISESKDVILATFSFASEGFDAKGLDTLVLASPKIEQSVGRILRQKENDRKHVPCIFDIVDKFSIFLNQARKRSKFYEKNNYILSNAHDTKSIEQTHLHEFAFI